MWLRSVYPLYDECDQQTDYYNEVKHIELVSQEGMFVEYQALSHYFDNDLHHKEHTNHISYHK